MVKGDFMSITEIIYKIDHIRELEVHLSDLYANPKLTATEARYVLSTLSCIREYADELKSKIN